MTEEKKNSLLFDQRSNNKERAPLREPFPKKEKILKFFRARTLPRGKMERFLKDSCQISTSVI